MAGGNSFTWAVSTMKQIQNTLAGQTLGGFVIPTDESFMSGDSIVLSIYGTDGALEGEYSFVDTDNAANFSLTSPGWYPLAKVSEWEVTDEDLADDVIVPFGKGVIITSGEADTTLTVAGEVLNQPTTVDVAGYNSFTWTGNSTPVNLTLGDFSIPTDQGFMSGDSIVLSIYGTDGSLQGEYSFVDTDNAANFSLTSPGWYPLTKVSEWEVADSDLANAVVIPAGKMVIITSGEADTTLTLPNPLAE
ncbi:MAG: hypothetical protein IJ173_00640 [Kiritimatiellae bacterium]|nr:hypothetical protein [Kiritimatiellia bacterium]